MFGGFILEPIEPLTKQSFELMLEHEPDYCLCTVGMALLKNRVENYRGIAGEWYSPVYYRRKFDSVFTHEFADDSKVPVLMYSLYDPKETKPDAIKDTFKEYKEITSIELWIKQSFDLDDFFVYIKEEYNTAYIFSTKSDSTIYHTVCSVLPALFPKLFVDKPLTKKETEMLKAMTNKTPGRFIEFAKDILAPMKADLLRTELGQCFNSFRKQRLNYVTSSLRVTKNKIDEILKEYAELEREYEDLVVTYEGLKVVEKSKSSNDDSIINYICENKSLHNVTFKDGTISFSVSTLLTNFDVEKYKLDVQRKNIYEDYTVEESSPFADKLNRKLLMDALFGSQEPELYVRMRGRINLGVSLYTMGVNSAYSFGDDEELINAMTNPHFELHGCPGQNRGAIIECLRAGDLISALECSIAATGGINMNETEFTFRPFMNKIFNCDKKIIQRFDGKKMTPKEALLYLKERKNEEA